ncbi:YdcF family protein [Streptomyces sp. NPDC057638]|uniref:YdcF family protein n=1 Tax=Streptomyces sp. NPDC057638 TaxID=3346190 RepID=UPI00369991EB
MSGADLGPDQVRDIARAVDIEAPPPPDRPTAHLVFGTNQTRPVEIAAERYHRGLAPLIILTGGVNRHTGIVEGRVFHGLLRERGVPDSAIRYEDRSANTWQNVEFALPYLREAVAEGWTITAVAKWYHRRAVHCLATLAPFAAPFHALSWDPVYAGRTVTRQDWTATPDGRRRVLREAEEVPRRVADGGFAAVRRAGGAWRLTGGG